MMRQYSPVDVLKCPQLQRLLNSLEIQEALF